MNFQGFLKRKLKTQLLHTCTSYSVCSFNCLTSNTIYACLHLGHLSVYANFSQKWTVLSKVWSGEVLYSLHPLIKLTKTFLKNYILQFNLKIIITNPLSSLRKYFKERILHFRLPVMWKKATDKHTQVHRGTG